MKFSSLLLTLLISSNAMALSLLQETKDILCSGQSMNVTIEKKDRYIEMNGTRFMLHEFLDSAVLTKFDDEYALIQLLPKNTAVLIVGELLNFQEKQCNQVGAGKSCDNGNYKLHWTPTELGKKEAPLPVLHYGVYPNDGTFFVAYENQSGLALIDFGSKFSLLSGVSYSLNCQYK